MVCLTDVGLFAGEGELLVCVLSVFMIDVFYLKDLFNIQATTPVSLKTQGHLHLIQTLKKLSIARQRSDITRKQWYAIFVSARWPWEYTIMVCVVCAVEQHAYQHPIPLPYFLYIALVLKHTSYKSKHRVVSNISYRTRLGLPVGSISFIH